MLYVNIQVDPTKVLEKFTLTTKIQPWFHRPIFRGGGREMILGVSLANNIDQLIVKSIWCPQRHHDF